VRRSLMSRNFCEPQPDYRAAELSVAEAMNVLALVRKPYNVDPARVYRKRCSRPTLSGIAVRAE
jgi:hypothetical protein